MTKEQLAREPLAQLHARASELGVPRYRLLRREELAEEIAARGDDEPLAEQAPAEKPERERRPRERRPREKPEGEQAEGKPAEGEPTTGVLDIVPAGHGFLRMEGTEPGPDDVYVSASQIRRCELRAGDQIEGPARPPRRGERHPALVRVERVNGGEPGAERTSGFDDLTPVAPHRRVPLAPEADDVLVRSFDLLAPLAFGQRVLILAQPHSGRTTLLRGLVRAIGAADDAPPVIVLLVDERPEEVTAWKRAAEAAEIALMERDCAVRQLEPIRAADFQK